MMKTNEMYFPVIYKDIENPAKPVDDNWHSPPAKHNLYWSKRSSKPDLMSNLSTLPNLSTKPDMVNSLSTLPNLSTKPDLMSTLPNLSTKLDLMSSLSTLPILSTKRSVYWSKRSQLFPTLPFSTIVRNGKPKMKVYWNAE